MIRLLLILCLLLAPRLFAEELTILELKHRLPEQVLPTLLPLVAPGGTLVGANNQLFVKTTPENLQQIISALAAIDTPLSRLLISVRQSSSLRDQQRQYALNGMQASQSGVRVQGSINLSQGDNQQAVTQQLQTVDGGAAQIFVGRSIPVTMHSVVMGQQGAIASEQQYYVDIGSGFTATPRLIGDRVTLTIHPLQQQQLSDGIHTSELSTEVSGRLGEWLAVGQSDLQQSTQHQALLGRGSSQGQQSQQVWLKVDRMP